MRVVDLDRDTVKRGLSDGSMLVIDVREQHEYAAGHIPGAVSHPLSEFDPPPSRRSYRRMAGDRSSPARRACGRSTR